jgi:hypothetical protein
MLSIPLDGFDGSSKVNGETGVFGKPTLLGIISQALFI